MYSNISQKDDWMYDTDPLRTDSLPPWMEPNTIYLFRYDGENDHSDYFAKINCTEIVWADAVETDGIELKNRFCFRFEVKDKIHLFCTDFATVVNDWLRAEAAGKRCEAEKDRWDNNEIEKNIDPLITAYKQKKSKRLVKYYMEECSKFFTRFDEDMSKDIFQNFLISCEKSQENLKTVIANY